MTPGHLLWIQKYHKTITFDPEKRDWTLRERGIDFADAAAVFGDVHYTRPDDRHDYGEPRFVSIGTLRDGVVVIVWTPREDKRRLISMRYANDREKAIFGKRRAD